MVNKTVWGLSQHSSGIVVRFATDATAISARWKLRSKSLGMSHMPATGVSGLDLYTQDESGRWRWLAVGIPKMSTVLQDKKLVEGLRAGRRNYMLYLPLYNGVESLEIGVDAGAYFVAVAARKQPPIIFYGTSIVQGGCASRPGMCHPAILGRRLDRPIINLGFSGNGRMDQPRAELLAELDGCVYVIDCLPNMQGPSITQAAESFVRTIRKARPKRPIVLVEDRTYSNAPFLPNKQKRNSDSRAALRRAYENLVAGGVGGLHYVQGVNLLGEDGEATVDGSHPTDLGFVRMADALEPVLKALI